MTLSWRVDIKFSQGSGTSTERVKITIVLHNTPNGYIMPMEFRVHFFPCISAFTRRTKMHLNGVLLIGADFFKIIVPL